MSMTNSEQAANTSQSLWSRLKNLTPYTLALVAQLFVLIPHISHLPAWLTIYGFAVIVSQLPAVRRRAPWAKRLYAKKVWYGLQLAGFLAGLLGIFLTYRTAFGLDVGVSFLLLCLISKLLELFSRRDAYVVLNLSLFVLAGAFLMDQGLSTSVSVFLGVLVVMYAMIAHNDAASVLQVGYVPDAPETASSVKRRRSQNLHDLAQVDVTGSAGRLRALSMVAFLAIPLMVVLFIFFPRLPPLWSINLSGANAKTGMSDSMSPGDFASLSQSTELAFRVLFKGQVPTKNALYFRGMVFSNFDGITWRASGISERYPKIDVQTSPYWLKDAASLPKQNPLSYDILMQPTNQRWLFALDVPFSTTSDVQLTREYVLEAREPVATKFRYSAVAFDGVKDEVLDERLRSDSLALPSEGNLQARTFAKALYNSMNRDPARYSDAILNWIRTQNFSYTLEPPPLFNNRIDEFLFTTRQGFCEHYASAYTFLMRSAGVPARVVVGYQGGEMGRDGESWEVRQMDAHAWTEIWLAGRGWVRVDPTAAISPERVNSGMNALTEAQGAALFGDGATAAMRYQQYKMLHRMRKLMDHAGFIWQRDVVGFDQDKQKHALLKWLNLKSQYTQVLVMFGLVFGFIAVFVGVVFWRRRKVWHPLDAPFIKLSKSLQKQGLDIKPNEGIIGWLVRLEGRVDMVVEGASNKKLASSNLQSAAKLYRRARFSVDSDQLNHADAVGKINTLLKATKKVILGSV